MDLNIGPKDKSLAEMWGYRAGSKVAQLIESLYEIRIKYGTNYRLERIGKNQFRLLPGDNECLDVWNDTILEQAQVLSIKVTQGGILK